MSPSGLGEQGPLTSGVNVITHGVNKCADIGEVFMLLFLICELLDQRMRLIQKVRNFG